MADEIRMVDLQDAMGNWKRRNIRVTDGVSTATSTMQLTHESDYRNEWTFYAFGRYWTLISELEYDPKYGTVAVRRIEAK